MWGKVEINWCNCNYNPHQKKKKKQQQKAKSKQTKNYTPPQKKNKKQKTLELRLGRVQQGRVDRIQTMWVSR